MEQNPYEAPHNSEETPKAAPSVENTGLLFTAGVAAMLFALLFQNVTLTRNSYRDVLVIALVLTVFADACLAAVIWRGPTGLRLLTTPNRAKRNSRCERS